MKFVLLLLAVAGIVYAAKNVKITSKVISNFQFPKSITIENEKVKNALSNTVEKLAKLEMEIDDAVDEILEQVADLLLEYRLDPLQIPDIDLAFEYKPNLITYRGELNLWGGWLQDVITIHRSGESLISLEGSLIRAKIPIAFDDLILTYLYSATIMDLGPHGSIHGKLYDVVASFDVTIDMDTKTVILNEFSLDAGDLGLKFYGYGILDWLVNLLIDVVENILHETIVEIMNKIVGGIVQYIVDYVNDSGILGRVLSHDKIEAVPAKLTFGHQMPKIHLKQILRH